MYVTFYDQSSSLTLEYKKKRGGPHNILIKNYLINNHLKTGPFFNEQPTLGLHILLKTPSTLESPLVFSREFLLLHF
jgi:hypothetical protein